MSSAIGVGPPAPPASFTPSPLMMEWEAHRPLRRCFPSRWGPLSFFPGGAGGARFSSFVPAGESEPLPVLYTASSDDGALSETVLRDVPVRGLKRIFRSATRDRALVELLCTRRLRLADCTSVGLRRLGVSRSELIESDRRAYPVTALWARAIHADPERFDGIVWVSRQHDTSLAVMLFGDRVRADELDLHLDRDGGLLPLLFGPGREVFDDVCDRADITVVDP